MLAIVLSVHQLTALVSCLVSCSYVGHCFIGPSIDSFGILFDIFIVLSVHQLPTWVSCLISLLFCRSINWQLWYPVWYLYCFVGPSIDSFDILFGIFIVLSVHQLTALISCLVSSLFCRSINWQLWYPVWYLHCFVGPSIDSFGILFGIFIVLSVHQLTALVSCLVSSLFCRSINWQLWYSVWYLYCFVGSSIDSFGIMFGIFIVLSVHQLTALVFCLVSSLFCRSINWQLWYPVWYLYCFVGPSIDNFGILFGIFIALSVHQLTTLVSCLVSLLFCRFINWQLWYPVWYLHCFVGHQLTAFGILFGIFIVLSVHQLTAFGVLFGIFIVLSVHQLTALVSCLVSSLFCRSINWQHWYPVWYLVVMLAIVLSVHQLTALVSCLVSCSYVVHCFVGPSIDSFGILFGIL